MSGVLRGIDSAGIVPFTQVYIQLRDTNLLAGQDTSITVSSLGLRTIPPYRVTMIIGISIIYDLGRDVAQIHQIHSFKMLLL